MKQEDPGNPEWRAEREKCRWIYTVRDNGWIERRNETIWIVRPVGISGAIVQKLPSFLLSSLLAAAAAATAFTTCFLSSGAREKTNPPQFTRINVPQHNRFSFARWPNVLSHSTSSSLPKVCKNVCLPISCCLAFSSHSRSRLILCHCKEWRWAQEMSK